MASEKRSATAISLLAICGQGIAYWLSVVLAQHLSVAGFEAYVVASAVFIVLVTLVPQGLDKYALKVIPVLAARSDWSGLRGYIVFGIRRTLWGAVVAAMAVTIWAFLARRVSADARIAIVISCAALPVGALVHFGLEALTALGKPFAATAIFRVAVPSLALLGAAISLKKASEFSATTAVACWGIGWLFALAWMAFKFWRLVPFHMGAVEAKEDVGDWTRAARPFWIYRVSLAVLGQAGVISLEWFQASPSAVGAYAVALSTAGLAQVLATATNRVYSSRLAIMLEHRAVDQIDALRVGRLRWLVIPLSVYLIVVFAFSRELLAFFRPEFADEGVVAIRLLASLTVASTFLAMAPTYLKFRRQNRAIYIQVAIAAALQIVFLVILVPSLGATGAAMAYVVAMGYLYTVLASLAHRELTTFRGAG